VREQYRTHRCGRPSKHAGAGRESRSALGTIARCSHARRGDGRTHARAHAGQQSMHARGAAEHARSRTRTRSREVRMRPGAIPACTEAGIEKSDDILSWRARMHAGAAAQSRGAAERARSRTHTGGRGGMHPGATPPYDLRKEIGKPLHHLRARRLPRCSVRKSPSMVSTPTPGPLFGLSQIIDH
jgi:hypothetical protein